MNKFLLLYHLDSNTKPFSLHDIRRLGKNCSCPLKKQRFSFIFATFSVAKTFRQLKIFGWVNYKHGWLLIHKEGLLGQWVARERASKFLNAVGRWLFGKVFWFLTLFTLKTRQRKKTKNENLFAPTRSLIHSRTCFTRQPTSYGFSKGSCEASKLVDFQKCHAKVKKP